MKHHERVRRIKKLIREIPIAWNNVAELRKKLWSLEYTIKSLEKATPPNKNLVARVSHAIGMEEAKVEHAEISLKIETLVASTNALQFELKMLEREGQSFDQPQENAH